MNYKILIHKNTVNNALSTNLLKLHTLKINEIKVTQKIISICAHIFTKTFLKQSQTFQCLMKIKIILDVYNVVEMKSLLFKNLHFIIYHTKLIYCIVFKCVMESCWVISRASMTFFTDLILSDKPGPILNIFLSLPS